MCVDKHHYKCCGCISLTAATAILGCLYLLATIYYAIISEWGAFAIYLITTLVFIMVIARPNDANIRKLLFYIVTVLSVIGLVAACIFFFVILANGDFSEYVCSYSSSGYHCEDINNTWVIIWFVLALCLDLLLVFCTAQILYFGWKE